VIKFAAMLEILDESERVLWEQVLAQFRLPRGSLHGPGHWLKVRRNGLLLAAAHAGDAEVVRLFAVFHDACRENEYHDPQHGPRGAELAVTFRAAGQFALADARMDLLVTACRIHNGAGPQVDPTLSACLDADRLDLGRVGITPDPALLSTATAQSIARRRAWHELT
jgi:uncharacterized protein